MAARRSWRVNSVAYAPVGVEQTASGYEVALKNAGADLFSIWNTDSNGNFLSYAVYSGKQRGAGIAGDQFPPGSERRRRDRRFLDDDRVRSDRPAWSRSAIIIFSINYQQRDRPELKYNGAPVVAGQFAPYVPVGVEQTASGYEVALKNAGANQFSVWNTDSNGNFLSYTVYSGTSAALESLETSFHQDLNGDGVVFTSGSGSVGGRRQPPDRGRRKCGADRCLFGNDLVRGRKRYAHDRSLGELQRPYRRAACDRRRDRPRRHHCGAGATIAYSGNNSPGTLTVSDGTHTASIALLGNYSLANFTASSDGHGGTSVIDPPLPQASTGCSNSESGSAVHPVSDIGLRMARSGVARRPGTLAIRQARRAARSVYGGRPSSGRGRRLQDLLDSTAANITRR